MKKCNPVIGIISYFPDDPVIREIRIKRFTNLIQQCKEFFNGVNIMIIAQNWKDFTCEDADVEFHEDKLGICKARIALRKKFLKSKYSHLIMMDDDIKLTGTQVGYYNYLDMLTRFPEEPILINRTLMSMLGISRKCYKETPLVDTDVENTGVYEDALFTETLRKKYKISKFTGYVYCNFLADFAHDKYSTWRNQNK